MSMRAPFGTVLSAFATIAFPFGAVAATFAGIGTPFASASGKLVVGIGDSNMVGQADIQHVDTGLGLASPYPAITYRRKYALALADPVSWINVGPESLQPYAAGGGASMGIELTCGRELAATGAATHFAQFAINGTRAADYIPAATSPVTGGNLMAQLKAFVHSIIDGTSITLDAVIIELGTNDAANGTDAGNLSANLALITAALRAEFGSTLRVGLFLTNVGCTNPNTATARAQATSYAAGDTKCVLVNTDELALKDGLHYFDDGYASRGQWMAYALSDLLGYARPVPAGPAPRLMGSAPAEYGSSATLIPRSWAGQKNGDLEILIVVNGFANTAPVLTSAQGFVQVGASQVSTFSTFTERISIYQRAVVTGSLVNGRMPPPTITPGTNENAAVILTVRGPAGVVSIDAFQGSANFDYNTVWTTYAGVTTLHADDLILLVYGGFSGGGLNSMAPANAGISLVEQRDGIYFATADYVLLGVATGGKVATGATGNTSLPTATNAILAGFTIALKAA